MSNNKVLEKFKFQDLPNVPDNQKITAPKFNNIVDFQNSPVLQIAGSLDDTDIVIDETQNYGTTIVVAGATRTITANASGHLQGNNIKQRYTFNVDCTLTLSGFDALGNNTGKIDPLPAGTYDFKYIANRNGRNIEINNASTNYLSKLDTAAQGIVSRLGIGTSSPAKKFVVSVSDLDDGFVVKKSSSSNNILTFLMDGTSDRGEFFLFDSGTLIFALRPSTNPSWIKTGNNFGIGISSPETQLHVAGAITQDELSADPSDPTEGKSVIWPSDGTESGNDGDIMRKTTAGGITKTAKVTPLEVIKIPIGARDTDHTTGANKSGLHIDYDYHVETVTLEFDPIIADGGPTGSSFIVDINVADIDGTSLATILSTKLSVDAGEFHSSTAATPAVISTNAIAKYKFISIDIDQIGSTLAGKGGFVTLNGYRT